MRRISPQLCAQLSCISLFLIFNSPLAAQIRPGPGTRADIGNREWNLANLRKDLRSNAGMEQQARILLTALKDDFRQLQMINNDLMQRTLVDARKNPEAISSKEIRARLSEIHKRADRLRANLRLPNVELPKEAIDQELVSAQDLSKGLLMLDQLVMKFVENPIFQRPGILDTQQSMSAADDLGRVLRVTKVLKKLAKQDSAVEELGRKATEN